VNVIQGPDRVKLEVLAAAIIMTRGESAEQACKFAKQLIRLHVDDQLEQAKEARGA
jgi:hypothetical protein